MSGARPEAFTHGAAENCQKARLFPSTRLVVTILAFFCAFITNLLRLNMGFAMVCMVRKTPSAPASSDNLTGKAEEDECSQFTVQPLPNATDIDTGEFEWEKSLQGALLGAYFYGYILTQVPAGWLCERFGSKRVLGTGQCALALLTLLIPEAARISPHLLLAVRALQGMFAGATVPGMHMLVGSWAPLQERGLLMSITYSGMQVGTLVTFPMCGLLCDYGFDGGWPSVFYITGVIGLTWVLAMIFLVYDSPSQHPRISPEEKAYLQSVLHSHRNDGKSKAVPWLPIMRSKPMWAIAVAHLCANWGNYTLIINLPLYMKEVLRFDIKQNGFLSALPYLCSLFTGLCIGKLTDWLVRREALSLTALRKTFTTTGMIIPATCLITISFFSCQERYLAVTLLATCQGFTMFAYSGGFFYNHVDIAPRYVGILMGISNMFGQLPGVLSPNLVGLLTPQGTRGEWLVVFMIAASMYVLGATTYLLLGSAELQPWAEPATTKQEQEEAASLKANDVNPVINT